MEIRKDLEGTLDSARTKTAELLEHLRRGRPEQCDAAWAEAQAAMRGAKDLLADMKTTLEIDAEVTREMVADYVRKVEEAQAELDLAMRDVSDTLLHRSLEGAELAIARARRALERAEGLMNWRK